MSARSGTIVAFALMGTAVALWILFLLDLPPWLKPEEPILATIIALWFLVEIGPWIWGARR